MISRPCVWIAIAVSACFCGCDNPRDPAKQTDAPSDSAATHEEPQVEPGFYTDGPEYDRVSDFLAKSNASVTLDYHQGVEWYDERDIEPGFYTSGPAYDRVSDFLAKSNASVTLDYHQGIEWYDKTEKAWLKITNVEDIKPLLTSIKTKHLVTISRGKAMWNKYDEYIVQIVGYANELGFEMTVVTNDNASGLVVSKVITHGN